MIEGTVELTVNFKIPGDDPGQAHRFWVNGQAALLSDGESATFVLPSDQTASVEQSLNLILNPSIECADEVDAFVNPFETDDDDGGFFSYRIDVGTDDVACTIRNDIPEFAPLTITVDAAAADPKTEFTAHVGAFNHRDLPGYGSARVSHGESHQFLVPVGPTLALFVDDRDVDTRWQTSSFSCSPDVSPYQGADYYAAIFGIDSATTCVVTLEPAPTTKISITNLAPADASQLFTYSVTAPSGVGTTELTHGEAAVLATRSTETATITRTAPAGWRVSSVDCDSGEVLGVSEALTDGHPTATITVAVDQPNMACTILNEQIPAGSLTLTAAVLGGDAADQPGWVLNSGAEQPFSLGDRETAHFEVNLDLPIEIHQIDPGWIITGATCDGAAVTGPALVDAFDIVVLEAHRADIACNLAVEPARSAHVTLRLNGDASTHTTFRFAYGDGEQSLRPGESTYFKAAGRSMTITQLARLFHSVESIVCNVDAGQYQVDLAAGSLTILESASADIACEFVTVNDTPEITVNLAMATTGDADPDVAFGVTVNGRYVYLAPGETVAVSLRAPEILIEQDLGSEPGWESQSIDCGDTESLTLVLLDPAKLGARLDPSTQTEFDCTITNQAAPTSVLTVSNTFADQDPDRRATYRGPNGDFDLGHDESISFTFRPGSVSSPATMWMASTTPDRMQTQVRCTGASDYVVRGAGADPDRDMEVRFTSIDSEVIRCEFVHSPTSPTTITLSATVVGEPTKVDGSFNLAVDDRLVNIGAGEAVELQATPGHREIAAYAVDDFELVDINCAGIDRTTFDARLNVDDGSAGGYARFVLGSGDDAECEFVYRYDPVPTGTATLTLVDMSADPDYGAIIPISFSSSIDGDGSAHVFGGGEVRLEFDAPSAVTVSFEQELGRDIAFAPCLVGGRLGAWSWGSISLEFDAGDQATCEFTVTSSEPRTMTLEMATTAPATGETFEFHTSDGQAIALSAGESVEIPVPGWFSLYASELPSWEISDVDCSTGGNYGSGDQIIRMFLDSGEHVTCRITAQPVQTATVTVTAQVQGEPDRLVGFVNSWGRFDVPSGEPVGLVVPPDQITIGQIPHTEFTFVALTGRQGGAWPG